MLDKLPCEITTLIFKHAVGVQAQCTKSWMQTIQLSLISRKLRVLSKPWIHYWAFIECYDAPEEVITGASDSEIRSIDDEFPDEPVWMTNVDFHTLCGYTSSVRKLELYLDAPVHLLTFFGKSMEILDTAHAKWAYIRFLNINLYSVLDEVDEPDIEEHVQQDRMAHSAYLISQSLVSLTKLHLRTHLSHHTNPVTIFFAGKLVDLYSSQLQVLFNQVPIDPSGLRFSEKFKRIGLFMHGTGLSDSFKLNYDLLESIFLVNVPQSFSWSALESQQEAGVYDFPNLQSFEIFFNSPRSLPDSPPNPQPNELRLVSSDHHNSKMVVKVNMPRLKKLRLEFASPECPVFYSQDGFPNINDISISGSFSLIQQLQHLRLQDVGFVYIYIDSIFASDEESFYKVTNNLFGEIKIRKDAALSTRCTFPFTINQDSIKWTYLNDLALESKIEFTILMDILRQTPSLHVLEIGEVCFERFINDVGHIDSPQWTELIECPINFNVKILKVSGRFTNYSTHFISNIIYFLIQRLPGLEMAVVVAPMFKDQINMLLKQSKKPHPGVRQITVEDVEV